jgi:hypothetical protein
MLPVSFQVLLHRGGRQQLQADQAERQRQLARHVQGQEQEQEQVQQGRQHGPDQLQHYIRDVLQTWLSMLPVSFQVLFHRRGRQPLQADQAERQQQLARHIQGQDQEQGQLWFWWFDYFCYNYCCYNIYTTFCQ